MGSLVGLEVVFLAALCRDGEQYGLQLLKTASELNESPVSLGGLYTTLNRMEKKGLVQSRWGDETDAEGGRHGARRRYFKPTALGTESLADAQRVLGFLMASKGVGIVG